MIAPFDGVIESVEVAAGDVVGANTVAFVFTDRERIVVELTVTETDLLDLAPGQVGLASFDAIDEIEYPVRITSVSRVQAGPAGAAVWAAVDDDASSVPSLSDREFEILRLIASGRTNPQIARELDISVGTVKWHSSQIFGKLSVKNRTEAAARAKDLGLLA